MASGAPLRLEETDIELGGVRERRSLVDPELGPWVESFSVVEPTGGRRVFLPDARARMMFVRSTHAPAMEAYALGPRAGTLRKDAARGDAIMVRLAPGALPALLGVATSDLAGAIVPLAAVWGDGANRLLDQLAQARDHRARLAVVARALVERARVPARPRTDAPLIHAASAMLDEMGDARVSAVARHLGVSERHLRRVFEEAAGVSPKVFARIVRLRRAVALARGGSGADWATIALDAGYFDQAHMIGDFRRLTGSTPPALCRELAGSP